jgi:Raf kinase inhibitor-like YbhB/YbcL family protein
MRHLAPTLFALAFPLVAACSADDPPVTPAADAAIDRSSTNDASSSQDGTTADALPDVVPPTDATVGDASGAFVLTSSAYAEGGVIPTANSCKGVNDSPPLAWSGAPAATKSFALTFIDKSNSLVHSAMFDVPASTTALAAALPKVANPPTPAGMKQVKAYDNTTFGYLGPCPPNQHTYTWTVYALDVAALPNVTTNSTRAQVVTELGKHTLATATLTATFTP